MRTRIFVADVPEMELPLRAALAKHEVHFVSSYEAALRELERDNAVRVIGIARLSAHLEKLLER